MTCSTTERDSIGRTAATAAADPVEFTRCLAFTADADATHHTGADCYHIY